jgi:hypothetical protein
LDDILPEREITKGRMEENNMSFIMHTLESCCFCKKQLGSVKVVPIPGGWEQFCPHCGEREETLRDDRERAVDHAIIEKFLDGLVDCNDNAAIMKLLEKMEMEDEK